MHQRARARIGGYDSPSLATGADTGVTAMLACWAAQLATGTSFTSGGYRARGAADRHGGATTPRRHSRYVTARVKPTRGHMSPWRPCPRAVCWRPPPSGPQPFGGGMAGDAHRPARRRPRVGRLQRASRPPAPVAGRRPGDDWAILGARRARGHQRHRVGTASGPHPRRRQRCGRGRRDLDRLGGPRRPRGACATGRQPAAGEPDRLDRRAALPRPSRWCSGSSRSSTGCGCSSARARGSQARTPRPLPSVRACCCRAWRPVWCGR